MIRKKTPPPPPGLGFIPMDDWAYRRFLQGSKDEEFRIYGGRFVEKHYPVGRLVVISSGYGRENRALTRVRSFEVLRTPPDLEQWAKVYGPWPTYPHKMQVAAIGLDVLGPIETVPGCYPPRYSMWGRDWVGVDTLQAILDAIPTHVWSGPRARPGRPCQGAIDFYDLICRSLKRDPLFRSFDCAVLEADELPDSDALRRSYRDALEGRFNPQPPPSPLSFPLAPPQALPEK